MSNVQPFLDSTDVQTDGTELGKRMKRDGYLFIRGLMPPDQLESLRMAFLEIMRDSGWVKAGTPLEQAIADLNGFCVEPEPKYTEVYARLYKVQTFHTIAQHPKLLGLLKRMVGAQIMVHPHIIARTLFPKRDTFTTPAHQDFVPIQGSPDTYTAWIPLSDLPAEMGGLQLCSSSHKHGIYNFKPALGAGGTVITDPLKGPWVNALMKQGDVLFFHSYTVHQGLTNRSDRLRMSVDFRYQEIGDPINPNCLTPHVREVLTWDQVYADWPNDDGKYFWKSYDMKLVDFDTKYNKKRDEMAFEMAAQGDDTARSALQRIIAREPDQVKVKKAEELLAKLDGVTP